MTPEERLAAIAEMIELGDQRLLAADGPAGGQPPDLTLSEWRRVYLLAKGEDAKEEGDVDPFLMHNYQKLAERTSATATALGAADVLKRMGLEVPYQISGVVKLIRLIHGILGVMTEAGEQADALKRHLFYGAKLDELNIKEESGDAFWYHAEILNALGARIEDVMERNIAKLRERFPEKFTQEEALNRDLEKERSALEGKASQKAGYAGPIPPETDPMV